MKMRWLVLAVCLVSAGVQGGQVMLFSAADVGPDAWTWEGARLKAQPEGLVLTPARNDVCSVVLQDRFAWLPQGEVALDVQQVVAGTYTLQVLAFQGTTYLGAIDLVKDSAQKGLQVFSLDRLAFPKGTEAITFKLWVSRGVGTAVVIADLQYRLAVADDQLWHDERIAATTEVAADQVVWTPSDLGGTLRLVEGASIGSALFPSQIVRPKRGHLIVQCKDVRQCTLTAQVCTFDASGNYLDSRDVVRQGTASLSSALDADAWPEEAATFQVKLWLGGGTNASAVVQRIVVLP